MGGPWVSGPAGPERRAAGAATAYALKVRQRRPLRGALASRASAGGPLAALDREPDLDHAEPGSGVEALAVHLEIGRIGGRLPRPRQPLAPDRVPRGAQPGHVP